MFWNFVLVLFLFELPRKGSATGIWPDVPDKPCIAVISPPNPMSGVTKAPEAVESTGKKWVFKSSYIGPLIKFDRCVDSPHPYFKFSLTNHNYSEISWFQPAYSAFGCLSVTEENGFQIHCHQYRNDLLWTCLDITISCTKEFGVLARRLYLKVEIIGNPKVSKTYSECIYIKPKIIETNKFLDMLGIEVDAIDPSDIDCGPYYYYGVLFGSFFATFFVCACAPLSSENHTEVVFQYLSTDEEEEKSRKEKLRQAIIDSKAAIQAKLAKGLQRARDGKVDSLDSDDTNQYYTGYEYSDTEGYNTEGYSTKGSNTKGSNTKGSNTKGSNTEGSNTKGSSNTYKTTASAS